MPRSIDEIKDEFNQIGDLPTLPVIGMKLMDMLKGHFSMKQIGNVMQMDPSILSVVLKIANSALFAQTKKVDTLQKALVLLGTNEVSSIIVNLTFIRSIHIETNDDYFDYIKFWEHSVVVAHIASILAQRLRVPTHGEEYTAGLIHDIGKIILYKNFYNDFVEIFNAMKERNLSNFVAEKTVFGATHMELGCWLAEKWGLPEDLSQAILHHHTPEKCDKYMEVAALVSLANYFVNTMRLTPHKAGKLNKNPTKALMTLKRYTRDFDLNLFKRHLGHEISRKKHLIAMMVRPR